MKNKDLKRRILDISYKNNLSHLGSCLSAVDIIKEIFEIKKPNERFILSSGHAGLGLYVVLEQYGSISADQISAHHGVHPDKCDTCGIDCSTGSLGQGLPIAVGIALADKKKSVYCLISDGECAEGSIWESLEIASAQRLQNLKVYVNINGWGAYGKISQSRLTEKFKIFPDVNLYIRKTKVEQFPFLKGQDAHYHIMDEKDYNQAIKLLL